MTRWRSRPPWIASHSACRAVSGYTRNMTDEMTKAPAAKGGTVQVNFGCDFLSQRYYDGAKPMEAELRPKFMEAMKIADPATLDDVMAQIDHAVNVGGIDHVGIGTDFEGVGCVLKELDSYDKFRALTRALLEKGYSAEDNKNIYGGSLLRVKRAVKRAGELQGTKAIETKFQAR